jgi:hypothetical protein
MPTEPCELADGIQLVCSDDWNLVEAGDGVAETDRVACGEAGRDANHANSPPGCWQVPAVEGGDDGVPVDPRHQVPSLMLAAVSTWRVK